MDDLISRQAALDAFNLPDYETLHYFEIRDILEDIPSTDAIPLEWIENHCKWLESQDNALSDMIIRFIQTMVKKWKEGFKNEID